jgi:hypothetical protein
MSNSAIGLSANVNQLIHDGWYVEMETGMRGGELRSWVTLRHWERGEKFKARSLPGDLFTALKTAMVSAGLTPWDPSADNGEAK